MTPAPAQPYNVSYSINTVTGIVTVKGHVNAANQLVRATFHDGTIAEGYSDANGAFAIDSQGDVVGNGVFRVVGVNADDVASRPIQVNYIDVATIIPVAITQIDTNTQTGQVTVQGTAAPNAPVKVTFPDGQVVNVVANAQGEYTATSVNDVNGNGQIAVESTNPVYGTVTTDAVDYIDTVDASTVNTPVLDQYTISGDDLQIGGKAGANNSIFVYDENGNVIGECVVDANGEFSVVVPAYYNDGGTLKVTASKAGRESDPATLVTEPVFAADNHASVVIDGLQPQSYEKTQSQTFSKLFGSSLLSKLGLGKFGGTFDFKVEQGYQQDVTATASSKSLAAVLDKTQVTLYQKQADGSWKAIGTNKDKGLLDIVIFGEKATIKAKGLDAGEYRLGFDSDPFVGIANTLTVDVKHLSYKVDGVTTNTESTKVIKGTETDSKTFFKLFSSPLLSMLGKGQFSGTFDFAVKAGETQDITATATSKSIVALLDQTQITLYKKQANGSWKAVGTNKDKGLFDIVIFGEKATIKATGLDAGEYRLGFESSPFVGIANSLTVNLKREIYDAVPVNNDANDVTGNVIADANAAGQVDILGSNSDITLSILKNGQYVDVTGTVEVQGQNGTLIIAADGSYTYKPASNLSTVVNAEEFSYKITNANGDSSTATLSIDFSYNWKGTDKADVFVSSAGTDTFTTGKGIDTLIFKVLDNSSNTGGNGHDKWTDFEIAKKDDQGDKIDISDLLVGFNGNAKTLSQYVSVSKEVNSNGKIDTVISIDRDGAGKAYDKVDLLTLNNVDTTLEALLNNNQIIY